VAANPTSPSADPAAGRELLITRTFDAPRELVFKMWTDPAHLIHWMGPRGFTFSELSYDVRPGGKWRGRLREDNGARDLWQGGVYREIVPPERLVFTFYWDNNAMGPDPEHQTIVTITFTERDGKTTMSFHQAPFVAAEHRDGHVLGWQSAFDRLVDYIQSGAGTP
jgi:uncharacterized protein YndB with AHSA1/START domain